MRFFCHLILQISISIIVTMAAGNKPTLSGMPEVKDMADSNTQFTFDLLRECGAEEKGKNVFFAPYSITTALAMTCLGAQGDTAKEMKEVLKWPLDVPKKGFGSYLHLLKDAAGEKTPGYILVGAQRIYVDQNQKMKGDFSSATKEHFASQAEQVNFKGNPESERQKINAWVLEQTRQKIRDLLPDRSIDALTAMVLVQALYFKGNWMHKFDAKKTRPADFVTSGRTVTVNMMEQTREFNYGTNKELACAAVELPYASNDASATSHDLSMLILLPDAENGLDKLEESLTYDKLEQIRTRMHSVKVNLKLPRFTAESSFQLKKILISLGMRKAFGNTADFSGMVSGDDELKISEVFHKAVVEVNEEGSEAAAATAVVMMCRSMPIIRPFIADHPFLFFIIDERADVVLFAGRVMEPPAVDQSQK